MTLPKWKTASTKWDVLILGGYTLPGIWDVEVTVERKVQVDKSKDKNGTTLTDNGYQGAKVSLKGRLWTDEQVARMYAIMGVFHPRALDGVSTPVTIDHPVTAFFGIDAIYPPKWKASRPDAQFFEVQCDAIEWFPEPKPPAPRPPGASPPAPAAPGNERRLSEYTVPDEGLDASDFDPPPPDPRTQGARIP